ncbi:MAG TPA: pitrilysin family protein [Ignavibacteriaceae bacterium]|nr:pitrilysin family protein [Ignavibacteriaceae bacterium]
MTVINRKQKPVHSEILKFHLPEINTFILDNGLKVYFVQNASLPFLYMNIITDAGSKYDPAWKKGLAYLFAMTADEGAGEYDALQLSDEFDIIGANFGISCNQDTIYFSLQVLKDELVKGIELFTKVITQPHLDEEDFAREKRKVKTRIIQIKDDADEIANEVFEYKVFGDHNSYAFPPIGYEKDVDLISINEIRDFYKNNLTPERSFIVIVGDYNPDNFKQLLNSYLKDWKAPSNSSEALLYESSFASGIYLVNKKDSVQSEIRTGLISFKRNAYDYFARSILNTIFGGQFSSRINLNLREAKGYTYGAFSRFIYYKSSAYFYISTSVGIENTSASLKEIFNEIEKIREGVSNEELEFAKSSLIRKFPSNFESYSQIASNIIGQVIHSLPDNYFETYLEEINRVTADRILKAAQDNLNRDNFTTVIVGDISKLLPQLQKVYTGRLFELDTNGRELRSLN